MVEKEEEVVNTEVNEVVAQENVETPAENTETTKKTRSQFVNPYSIENFNWDASERNDEYSADERLKYEALYDQTLKAIGEHEVIEGTIVGKTSREAIVNIGYKSDGAIPISELRYIEDLKIGDKIDVYIETNEDITGQLVLSHKKARILKAWDNVNAALENEEIILGYIKCRTKGGMIVDVFGIEAFLPGSQIDVKPIRDYDFFVGKTMEFKVVKINHEFKNVVVSHKALIEAELELQKKEIMSNLKKGDILEGTVKNITSYGVFIDLGGVDGLIHITDLSWGRINNPEEIVKLDQKLNVVILDFDDDKKRIALGLKQLDPHPWDALSETIEVNSVVKGKVVVIADYGAFIEIAPGVEGLIHVSEMTWSQHLRSAQEFLKIGDEVEAIVLTIDRENRKMSFGIKQLRPDPWADVETKYEINSKHKGIVRNFTNFGVFVELEEGIDGLIHISDLSWSKKIKHPAEFTNINDEIEVVVLGIDKENRRLSLGHKQIEENPWDVFESVFIMDSIHQGTIISVNDKGAIISLPYGVEGFAPIRHIVKENNVTAELDETLEFKVIEFNKENKKIILSHSKIYLDKLNEEREKQEEEGVKIEKEVKKNTKKIKDNLEKTTFGDIEALANLKSDMEDKAAEKAAEKAKSEEKKEEAGEAEESK